MRTNFGESRSLRLNRLGQALIGVVLAVGMASTASAQTICIDESIQPSFEEQRLVNLLPDNPVPVSQQIMERTGFENFGPEFIEKLCSPSAPNT